MWCLFVIIICQMWCLVCLFLLIYSCNIDWLKELLIFNHLENPVTIHCKLNFSRVSCFSLFVWLLPEIQPWGKKLGDSCGFNHNLHFLGNFTILCIPSLKKNVRMNEWVGFLLLLVHPKARVKHCCVHGKA